MPLNFHPGPGTLLMCDFRGFKAPEMIKKRPVVVVSPRRRRGSGLYTVVPLNTKIPDPMERFHHLMDPRSVPVDLGSKLSIAKCDMLYTVSLARLSQVRRRDGYVTPPPQVLEADLEAIRDGVLIALDLYDRIRDLLGLDADDVYSQ